MTRTFLLTAAIAALAVPGCSSAPDHAAKNATPTVAASAVPSLTPSAGETAASIRISDKTGTVNIGGAAVDPRNLGVPLYPGATRSAIGGSFSDSDANGSTAITTLDANATFNLVDAWYKARVPSDAQPSRIGIGGETTVSYAWASRDGRTNRVVTINSNRGKPIITISVAVSNGPL